MKPNYSKLIAIALCAWSPIVAAAATSYTQHNLVSDIPGVADQTDTNLVNPWSIAISPSSPFWISDNHSGRSTLYNTVGTPSALVVTIPPPTGGSSPAAPTGIVFNNTTNFPAGSNTVSRFIFATEDGTIIGWNSGTNALLKVDNSGSGAIYKGLAIAKDGDTVYLYATDFHNGKVDVFDGDFNPITWPGAFTDTNLPAGYAPFNVLNIGTNLYVTYALQDTDAHDDVGGPGHGYVNIYSPVGELVGRFISEGHLNSPWGMAVAPVGFGQFSGALLIGNFGDGVINAFDRNSGVFLGTLSDTNNVPIKNSGLWALQFGNGFQGGATRTLYFTAGIPGDGQVEDHGLFGSISVAGNYTQHNLVSDLPGLADHMDTNLVNPWGIAISSKSPFWISDNHSGLSTVYSTDGSILPLVVNIPPPAGGTPPAAPTGIIANSTTNFLAGGAASHFIFATEDGTISAWASGTNAVLVADNSASGAIYKGLVAGVANGSNYLYASEFHNGKVDVFDGTFQLQSWPGAFVDTNLPAGFAPFNIQNIAGNLYVTYAKQDTNRKDDISGVGNGYVDEFSYSGQLVKRFASAGVLNSPWGLAVAPTGFGPFSGALLIGNFGDGRIHGFNLTTGALVGELTDGLGAPISNLGLWALQFGNGARGGTLNTLYFTAGIPGDGAVEDHGLFGSITAGPAVQFTSIQTTGLTVRLEWSGGTPPYLIERKDTLSDSAWVDVVTTSETNTTVPAPSQTAFYRILDQAAAPVETFTAWMGGAQEKPSAVTTTGTGFGTFSLEGTQLSYEIAYSNLSQNATAAHIHGSATTQQPAGVLVPFPTPSGTSGVLSGAVTVTDDQIALLRQGLTYFNIHTAPNPGGEIRGQIVPVHYQAVMNGANEVSSVNTPGTGLGSFTIVGNSLTYNVTYTNLSSPAVAAHIHGPAPTTANAGVIIPFATPTGTSGSTSGTAVLTLDQLDEIVDGLTYANVHTSAHGGGEIRGQLFPAP